VEGVDFRKWNAVDVPGEFSIHIPEAAQFYIDDEPHAFCVRLGKRASTTEIRISRHELARGRGSDDMLKETVREFLARTVPRVTGREHGCASVERCCTQENAVQGVAAGRDGRWWLVRAYDVGDDFFWLQWCGPKRVMTRTVLRVFESFTPERKTP
jgi:hypothetical protein